MIGDMTVQWFAVAFLLYVELAITLLLLIPFLKPATWKRIFNWPFFGSIRPAWTTLFYATLLILIILFADSIRTMMKYNDELSSDPHLTLDAKLDYRLKECRGQRNFYISGFTLFLILVIRRLISLIYQRAQLEAEAVALKKQAEQANKELTRRMKEEEKKEGGKGEEGIVKKAETKVPDKNVEVETVGPTQEEYDKLQEELKKAQVDLEAMKKQAESTNAEYDRVSEEYQKLQAKVQELEGSVEDKKDQ